VIYSSSRNESWP